MHSTFGEHHQSAITSNDIDDQAVMLNGWEQCYTQLEKGPFEARVLNGTGYWNTRLFQKETNRRMRKSFCSPGKNIWLATVLSGSAPAQFQGLEIDPGDIFIIRPGVEYELICHGLFDVVALRLDCDFTDYENRSDYLSSNSNSLVIPAALAGELSRRIDTAVSNNKALCDRAINTLNKKVYELDPERDSAAANMACIVQKAVDLYEHCLVEFEDLPSIPELAAYVGVSERSLEYGFAKKYGIPPIRYFTFVRLHGARRDIREGRLSVTESALKWGFGHLGRFSGVYRETFGELPSKTINYNGLGEI